MMKQKLLLAAVVMGTILTGLQVAAQEKGQEPHQVPSEVSASTCSHTSRSFNCVKYEKNYDGDTFTVNIPSVHPLIGDRITVRVNGIDSPEMDSADNCERKAALEARQATQDFLIGARRIDLKNSKRDKYFRVLADVRADGKSLAEYLVAEKLAVPYDGGHKDEVDWCKR